MPAGRVRKTKIVCTLGPATTDEATLRRLVSAGMDVARINLSHGTQEEHRGRISAVRAAAEAEGRVVAVLGDLGGPKIRLGEVAGHPELRAGQRFTLTARPVTGDSQVASVNYPGLPSEVRPGEAILLADGALELRVVDRSRTDVTCEVVTGGAISSRKGVNLPATRLRISAVTDKDREDIAFAVREKLDYLAVSFVRRAQDVKDARAALEGHAASIPIISKIEKPEALQALANIVDLSDAIMVARGDLGVEIPLERVPVVQKEIIRRTRMLGKPVITATQMLRSMVDSPKPTRAETTDIANAIIDGTDAVMLSEETAVGKYPVEAVGMMHRIALEVESAMVQDWFPRAQEPVHRPDLQSALAHAVLQASKHPDVSVIVTPSARGTTPMLVSRLRPDTPILMLTGSERVARRFALIFGVTPVRAKMPDGLDGVFELAGREAARLGMLAPGSLAVVTAGHPIFGTPTNLIYVLKPERE
ncbi:MAG: pyruvate kinase [Euryarchaeota archaeon]|nr:pyruvate kinase [Euryarchaeota archaeon]